MHESIEYANKYSISEEEVSESLFLARASVGGNIDASNTGSTWSRGHRIENGSVSVDDDHKNVSINFSPNIWHVGFIVVQICVETFLAYTRDAY